ncbi:MAG: hypothetical protein FWD74_02375 [Actinomycetia bacterium]|nr:hypothetical protein [Actinomycetes bacterium]
MAAAGIAAVALLGGCTARTPASPPDITTTRTITHTVPAPSPPPTTAINLGPTRSADGDCPFIDTQTAADLEGNRIGRVVVLSQRGKPVGCQFHFDTNWGPPRMTMQILAKTFHTETDAYNAMVHAGGPNAIGVRNLIPGVDAVLYQTTFYEPDGDQDWACAFAKGVRMVTVKTDQSVSSGYQDARNVAAAIAPKF